MRRRFLAIIATVTHSSGLGTVVAHQSHSPATETIKTTAATAATGPIVGHEGL